jgi:dihydrolipoamide dehydrogenase
MDFDLLIIGSGPGGYVAAIRASQLNMKVGVVEKAELGGICLNWGCIPTKALLKSAQIYEHLSHVAEFGITVDGTVKLDFEAIVRRSRSVADGMSKGVQFLFKKNKIEQIKGFGRVTSNGEVDVEDNGNVRKYSAGKIIIATGARSKEIPQLKQDGNKIIGYREAMTLSKLPKSIIVVGSGAIGCEFANFFNTLGSEVTLVEFLPRIVPNEDEEVSKQLERSFKKAKMRIMTSSDVMSADITGELVGVTIETPKGIEIVEAEIVLSAVGIMPNIENIGLEEAGVKIEKGKIVVDEFYKSSVENIYAIGDIVRGPALAHVASAEGITCVEKIAGIDVKPIDYGNIPSCTYTTPEIASCGMTELAAINAGFEIKVGKFPFTASGKASASGSKEGFVKLVFDARYGELLGAHMIGANVTEMISEIVVARRLEITAHELIKTIHPHPTMSEAIMEATAAALGEVIHL